MKTAVLLSLFTTFGSLECHILHRDFLRLKGIPLSKHDINVQRNNRSTLNINYKNAQYHDFPIQSCGGYEYFGFNNGYENKVSICEQDSSSNCKKTITSSSLRSWIQEHENKNCPKIAAIDDNPDQDFTFYSSTKPFNDFDSGLKFDKKTFNSSIKTDEFMEGSILKCGNWEDLFLLKIYDNKNNLWENAECTLHYFQESGGSIVPLEDCVSRIQLCQTSENCRPLFDGNTKANIIFRVGESETSNDDCPKLILQMNANGYFDKTGKGSNIYVSYVDHYSTP